jgi:hypothetical protein
LYKFCDNLIMFLFFLMLLCNWNDMIRRYFQKSRVVFKPGTEVHTIGNCDGN